MKKILSIIFVFCIVCSMCTMPTLAAEEYFYCYVEQTGVASNLLQEFMFRAVYNDAGKEILYCASTVKINGTTYKKSSAIAEVVVPGLFIRYTVSDGKVNKIDFDNTPQVYTGINYNPTTKKFDGISANLPIYYYYNYDFHIPILDKDHIYDVQVYDYALCITKIESKEKKENIDAIDISSGVEYTFNQYISVMCEAENKAATVVAKLYTASGRFIAEGTSAVGDEIIFESIENETANYKLEVWLENEKGKIISHIYEEDFSVYEVPVHRGKILRKAIDEGGIIERIILEVEDGNGVKTIYNCNSDRMHINKRLHKFKAYKDLEYALEEIPLNAELDYIIQNNEITILGFDDRAKTSFEDCNIKDGFFEAIIKTENVLFDFYFMLAIYDQNNELVKIVWESILAQEDGKTISFEADEKYRGYTVKVLTWNKKRFSGASDVISSQIR